MNITITKTEGAWTFGIVARGSERFTFEVKRCEDATVFGIDQGRIVKLWIATAIGYTPIATYERGWDRLPRCEEHWEVTQAIIDRFN